MATYRQAAAKLFSGSVANDNKITVNTGAIAKSLQAQFPEIANASITLPFIGGRPTVYLEPAQPALILNSQVSGEFLITTDGRTIMQLSSTSISQYKLPVVSDRTGVNISVNSNAMPPGDVSFITQLDSQLSAHQIQIASLVLPPASRELQVYLTGQAYYLRFNLEGNSSTQIGSFLAVYKYLKQKNTVPKQYIDLRAEGRAYYK